MFIDSPGALWRALSADARADAEAADAGGDVDEDGEVEIVYGQIPEYSFKNTYKINLMNIS